MSVGAFLGVDTPDPPELEKPVKSYSREELERILVRHYRGSTFNTCEHEQLPYMSGSPPMEIRVE